MITINGKEYRNLQEQVEKNKQDIAAHYNVDRVLAEFGIRIQGQIDSAAQLPDPATYTGAFGDAYAVGTSEPYDFYIWTRANVDAGYPNNYWFNVGPLAIAGPQGPQGPAGPRGANGLDGNRWYSGTSFPSSPSVGDYFLYTTLGAVYTYSVVSSFPTIRYEWVLTANLRGPQGLRGEPGETGATGEQGPQGPQGPVGPVSSPVEIIGELTSPDQLPDPSTVARNAAYLIRPDDSTPPDLYIITGETDLTWTNSGGFGYGTTVLVNGAPVEQFNADGKLNVIPSTGGVYVYINNASGVPELRRANSDAGAAGQMIVRDSTGRHGEPIPTARPHAANKGYVDDTIDTKVQGYATEVYVDTAEQRLSGDISALETNLEATDAKFEAYTPTSELDKQLDAKADKTDVNMRFNNVDYILGQFGIITAQEASGPTTGVDVPAKSAKVAAITEIGGATYKTVNLYPIPDLTVSGSTAQALSYTGDYELTPGTYSVSCGFTQTGDASTVKLSIRGYESFTEIYGEQTSTDTAGTLTVTFTVPDGDRGCRIYVYSNATDVAAQTSATFSKFMLNAGAPQPYSEYFAGLRNAATSEIVSEGDNLWNNEIAEYSDTDSFTRTSSGFIFKRSENLQGRGAYAYVKHPIKAGDTVVFNFTGATYAKYLYSDQIYGNQITAVPAGRELIYTADVDYPNALFAVIINSQDPDGEVSDITINYDTSKPYRPYIKRTLPIPSSVQNLPDYGAGIPGTNYYNSIRWRYDEATDKWVREYERQTPMVDTGTLNWQAESYYAYITNLPQKAKSNGACLANIPSSITGYVINDAGDFVVSYPEGTFSSSDEVKAAMSGVMLVYPLATPEISDISKLLPSNGLLGVQAGGTLTPVNEYNYPVPLNVEFQIINSPEVTPNE